jgi:peptidoglycan hydrolase CwlO-like protein
MLPSRRLRVLLARACALAALVALACVPLAFATDPGALSGQIDSAKAKEDALKQAAAADQSKVSSFQGRIDELSGKLDGLQSDLDAKTAELSSLQGRLRTARGTLVKLRVQVKRDQKILAQQLVGVYESAPPDVVHVLVDAKGFADLLERVDQIKAIGHQNAGIIKRLRAEKTAVTKQAERLGTLTRKQQGLVAVAATQRDAIAHIKLEVVNQQYVYVKARDAKNAKLGALRDRRASLEKQLTKLQDAQAGVSSYSGPIASGGSDGYGFFQAAGTNYSVGDEPTLAAKLNTLGKALHLHLIGLSGYRTPEHSIEVGGFPNDPHTKGQASDTPGVEGVSEATLNQYGLTRPFAGAAEADHIQLVGSI